MHTSLGPGAEFDIIRRMWRRLGDSAGASGDDCARVEIDGARLAMSTDLFIEGTHFRPGWLSAEELGWRATAAALSDLAAVAAKPAGVMVGLGISPEHGEEMAAGIMEGVGDAAAAVGAVVWGGDLARSDKLIVDVTVVGRLPREPVTRTGARAGDLLFVTGMLGGPAAALAAWNLGVEPEQSARKRFARPEPRILEAHWLRDRGARAMIDLSDGLIADAVHLAAASEVECVIEIESVPRHPASANVEQSAGSGEEYELLVSMRDEGGEAVREFAKEFDIPLTCVGRVEPGSGVRVLRGGVEVVDLDSFRHF